MYEEHCARWGALSKANQDVTSNSMTNADPCNIDLLRAKHPEPGHPGRDPVSLRSKLWPRTQNLDDYWSSDAGVEFLDKWFSIAKICQYFRTRSPVTMPLMDDMSGTLLHRYFLMTILNYILLFVNVLSSPT